MMLLVFELGRINGKVRFYGGNDASKGVLAASGRVCFTERSLGILERSGFTIRVNNGAVENVMWRK